MRSLPEPVQLQVENLFMHAELLLGKGAAVDALAREIVSFPVKGKGILRSTELNSSLLTPKTNSSPL